MPLTKPEPAVRTSRAEYIAPARGIRLRLIAVLLTGSLLAACSGSGTLLKIPEPLRSSRGESPDQQAVISEPRSDEKTGFENTPRVQPIRGIAALDSTEAEPLPGLEGEPISVNFESLPLPAFINEVFGNLLGLSFQIHPSLQDKKDLVTLRVSDPQTPRQIYALALQVLADYGVGVERRGDLLRVVPGGRATGLEPPLLVSGRTLPSVPVSHRPIFQFVSLNVVENIAIRQWLINIFEGQKLEIEAIISRNTLLLKGTRDVLKQVLAALEFLDQPHMRGRYSTRIEPVYLSADALAASLIDVLKTEGYAASRGSDRATIIIMPIKANNTVIAFAGDRQVLDHVSQWVKTLDRPGRVAGTTGLFFYPVKNTRAQNLASVLNEVLGAVVGKQAVGAAGGGKRGTKSQATLKQSAKLVVDKARNALVFQGTGEQWARLLPIVREMDKPTRSVLIEVTIAELTLTDQTDFGIEWIIQNANIGEFSADFSTLGALGIGASGLNTFLFNNAGQTRAVLNAFASSNQATILSTPRLMVRSGESASIDIGTEVPIVTSESSNPDLTQGGTSTVLRQIQYRKTGVILNVTPVVHAGDRIDLDITQEVSEAQPNAASNIDSPQIFNRSVSTSLTLTDGGSVLLGGLITDNRSKGHSGVPLLKDLPLVGALFRVDRDSGTRTELVILIIPYIINNGQEAADITRAFQDRLQLESTGDAAAGTESR